MFSSSPLEAILTTYQRSFASKVFGDESAEEDELMLVFGLTQTAKAANKQYWGRELGMCWQRLLVSVYKQTSSSFAGPIREGEDEICDLRVGNDAIDTKYRIGSGDSGTLKKFKQYATRIDGLGYRPVILILRNDNLHAAITACIAGGWTVLAGPDAFGYIRESSGVDLKTWLRERKDKFAI